MPSPRLLILFLGLVPLGVVVGSPATRPVSFSHEVAPLLVKRCQLCHGPDKAKGHYRLDTFEKMTAAGESKATPVVPGHAQQSKLYQLLTTDDEDDRMPKKGDALPAPSISLVKRWIDEGATFDGINVKSRLVEIALDQPQPDPPATYPHPVPILSLAFNPEGTELAAGGYHEVTLWQADRGKLLGRIKRVAQNTYALAYTPDGKMLAAACGSPGELGEVRLLDSAKRAPSVVLDRIPDVMLAARISPDGTLLAVGGGDSLIRIYDLASGRRLRLIEQHADWVTDLAFSPDGSKLASASRDKSARVFDARTGAMESAFLGHEAPLFGVAWNDPGTAVFTTGRDRRMRSWTAADAKPDLAIEGFDGEPFRVTASGGMLFCASSDGVVRQYDQTKGKLVRAWPSMGDWAYALAIDSKHHRIAAGSYSGVVQVWDTVSGKQLASFIAAPGMQP